jgi:hypothetical protein
MKNQLLAALSVAQNILHSKSLIKKISAAIVILAVGFMFTVAGVSHSDVRFSKPVVMMRGTIHSESGQVQSVKVSIRSTENPDEEITSSVSNSESGHYLVILGSYTKYVVRLQNAAGVIKEETIVTPVLTQSTVVMNKDFTIKTTSAK